MITSVENCLKYGEILLPRTTKIGKIGVIFTQNVTFFGCRLWNLISFLSSLKIALFLRTQRSKCNHIFVRNNFSIKFTFNIHYKSIQNKSRLVICDWKFLVACVKTDLIAQFLRVQRSNFKIKFTSNLGSHVTWIVYESPHFTQNYDD